MNVNALAGLCLVLAAIPCGLFLLNLLAYRRLPKRRPEMEQRVSVLIPARNEEANIRATLEAVLASEGLDLEVILLDDHSTDRTVGIVSEIAGLDARVRLESAPALPAGWCGKQHACHVLASLARHPVIAFIDADVRLAPDALCRMMAFMERSGVALASGVPRQELGTFSERLLLPLIHFILLGFLPMCAMRRTRWPSMSAGCGQLFIARRDSYLQCGGHAMLRDSLHDGLKLPRVFRQAGLSTDLFDATDLASCRMYRTDLETWRGLGKNAIEGLAAPGTIGPMTALLLGGQVAPFALLACAPLLSAPGVLCSVLAGVLGLLPRVVGAWRFKQPLGDAVWHPVGVLALLGIQWHALGRHFLGKPSEWKGRRYGPAACIEPFQST